MNVMAEKKLKTFEVRGKERKITQRENGGEKFRAREETAEHESLQHGFEPFFFVHAYQIGTPRNSTPAKNERSTQEYTMYGIGTNINPSACSAATKAEKYLLLSNESIAHGKHTRV